MKLIDAKTGQHVFMVSLEGGQESEKRLVDMGLLPGVLIKVLQNSGIGPVTVNVKGSKVALGHGLAQKIIVREMQQA